MLVGGRLHYANGSRYIQMGVVHISLYLYTHLVLILIYTKSKWTSYPCESCTSTDVSHLHGHVSLIPCVAIGSTLA